jgi:hypothetical protein
LTDGIAGIVIALVERIKDTMGGEPVELEFPPAAQLAKTTLFASGNEAGVRKSAAGDFFQ